MGVPGFGGGILVKMNETLFAQDTTLSRAVEGGWTWRTRAFRRKIMIKEVNR